MSLEADIAPTPSGGHDGEKLKRAKPDTWLRHQLFGALITVAVGGFIGGGVSSWFSFRVWGAQHQEDRRERWCADAAAFTRDLGEAVAAEVYFAKIFIYNQIDSGPPSAYKRDLAAYESASATRERKGIWYQPQIQVFFEDSALAKYNDLSDALDTLQNDVQRHQRLPRTPAMMRADSLHDKNGWDAENVGADLIRDLYGKRRAKCTETP